MDDSLDNIIDNIYKSEQESNAQYEYLEKLKSQIADTENKAKETENQCLSMKMDIDKKIKRLANREVMLLSCNVRQKCLQERIKELTSENKDLKKTMEDLKTRLKYSREKLCQQSRELVEKKEYFNPKQQTRFSHTSYFESDKEKNQAGESSISKGPVKKFSSYRKETDTAMDNLWSFDVNFDNGDHDDWDLQKTDKTAE